MMLKCESCNKYLLSPDWFLLFCTSPLFCGCWFVTALLSDWLFNTLTADPSFAAMTGKCWPLFRSCLCSWWRNRGGTSRGYRGKACGCCCGCCCCGGGGGCCCGCCCCGGCCCWLLAVARLALLLVLVGVEVPLLELAGWGWLTLGFICSGTNPNKRKGVEKISQ